MSDLDRLNATARNQLRVALRAIERAGLRLDPALRGMASELDRLAGRTSQESSRGESRGVSGRFTSDQMVTRGVDGVDPVPMTRQRLLTRPQAASLLGCSIATLDRKIRRGQLPAIHTSARGIGIERADVELLMETSK